MLHDPIGHGEERRRVVEPDVAGERRLARKDDRCGEDREDGDGGPERPEVGPASALIVPSSRPATASATTSGACQRRGRAAQGRELARKDQQREADRQHEWRRQALAGDHPHEPSAAEGEPRQDEREDDPGDEERQGLAHGNDPARSREA